MPVTLDGVFVDVIRGHANGMKMYIMPEIKKVIFNDPATIVYWTDGTKTVVKAGKDDTFDKETGLAMAIAKRVFMAYGLAYPRGYFKRLVRDAQDFGEKEQESENAKPSRLEQYLTDLLNNAGLQYR